jgi:hypothetical protein
MAATHGDGTVTSGTTRQKAEEIRPGKPGVIEWLQTVPGIVTALAGLLAAAGAFYGGAQLSDSSTPRPTVTVTARAAGAAVAAPAPTVTVTVTAQAGATADPVPTITGTALPPGAVYLSSLTALRDTEPDNGGGATIAPQQIGATTYPESVRFTCGDPISGASSLVYDVAGYRALEVTIGIPSNATNAAGNSAAIQFLKDGGSTQLIPQVTAVLDQPQKVTIPLTGISQLGISCTASNNTGEDVVLGDAALVR